MRREFMITSEKTEKFSIKTIVRVELFWRIFYNFGIIRGSDTTAQRNHNFKIDLEPSIMDDPSS